jgi:hypothetical protein
MMNLYEGNVLAQFQADSYHGGIVYCTMFRNWVHGMNHPFGFDFTNNIQCIDIDRFGYDWNLVGNVVGSTAVAVPSAVSVAPTNANLGTTAMYRFGYPDMGNNYYNDSDVYIYYNGVSSTVVYMYPINFDARVISTMFRTDNYDFVTAGIPDGTTALPASLVYSVAPSWWGTNAWPPIDAATHQTAMIPAQERFYGMSAGTNQPANPVGYQMRLRIH